MSKCDYCTNVALHTVWALHGGDKHLCCVHYVVAGYNPYDDHPLCIETYENSKETKNS